MPSRLEALFRANRTAVIGATAGVALVVLAWQQLRRTPAAIVVAGTSGGDTGASDLSAFAAGAAAAGSGFDMGAALGQAGIGLAGSVVGDLGEVSSTLAWSQTDMGGSLADALSQAIAMLTLPAASPAPAPAPAPDPGTTPIPPTPTPTPAPTPTTRWWPSWLASPPSSAIGAIVVQASTLNFYSVSGSTATRRGVMTTGGFSAYVDRIATVAVDGTPRTLVHLSTGGYAGRWIGKSRGTWYPKR